MNAKEDVASRLKTIRTVSKLFPHSKLLDQDGAMLYIELTQDIPLPEFQRCIKEAATRSDFMPTVKTVRDIYQKTRPDNPLLGAPTADEAWGDIMYQIRRTGHTGIPEFKSPYTATIVKRMGWKDLCMSENVEVTRSNFMRMYDGFVKRQEEVQSLRPESKAQLESAGVQVNGLITSVTRQLKMENTHE
jgi:hypothetical protein